MAAARGPSRPATRASLADRSRAPRGRGAAIDTTPTPPARRPFALAALGALGAAGSAVAVLAGSTVGSNPRPHWYRWWVGWRSLGYHEAHVVLYAGVGLLTLAWWLAGRVARRGALSARAAAGLAGAWGAPLALGVPLFSRDLYSYAATGALARRGLNPSLASPHALAGGPLYASIAQVWRRTPSPYGPLALLTTHGAAAVAPRGLMAQVLAQRAVSVLAFAALVPLVAALARRHRVDPGVALWLAALSPLALFSAVSSAHNDTLMLALVVGALLALEARRWRLAVALFALAGAVKLPAALGVAVAVAAGWPPGWPARARRVGEAVGIAAAVVAAATLAAGDGWTWLGPHALTIPTRLRVLITPAVAVGALGASALRGLGASVRTHGAVTVVQRVGEALAVLGIVGAVWRTRADNAGRALGAALLALVLLGPTTWPWYLLWGVTVLAATTAQRSRFLALTAGAAMLLVGPGGTPMIGGNGLYVAGPAALLAAAWYAWGRRWNSVLGAADGR